uniref:hypothetical protein n=1 Tax=Nitzschia ovalis TaxID=908985 RepID=UPI001EF9CC26|nr:hypothetical protein MKT70_pgp098 [Nitzschia ovalis]YP_010282996.1 hypothetical protein MKT70_pgp039 [Nitzschia ovalis]ULD15701.1 hypothetical protein [Nitzschia ovalis]ULD15760.1 hypothetical protein [Nitzschia ovalis]
MKIDTREFVQLQLMFKKPRSIKLFDLKKKQWKRYVQLVKLLSNQIYWEKANDYLKIVESFCNNKITDEDFQTKFYAIRKSAANNYERLVELLEQDVLSNELKLTKIEINPKSKGFTTAIDEPIFYLLDMDYPLLTVQEIQQIMNDTIRPKLEKYCNK